MGSGTAVAVVGVLIGTQTKRHGESTVPLEGNETVSADG